MLISELFSYIKTPEGFIASFAIIIGIVFGRKYIVKKIKSGDNSLNIQSKSVKIDGDVIGRDKNIFAKTYPDNMLSNQEKIVLKYLYQKYGKDSLPPREKATEIFSELEIKDGTDIRTLHDSVYLEIKGEDIVLTSAGIRYMDNLSVLEKAKIILPEEKRRLDEVYKKQRLMMEENERNWYRDSNK